MDWRFPAASRTSWLGAAAVVAVAATLVLTLVTCSGDDDSEPASTPSESTSTVKAQELEKANAELSVRIVQIGGGVKRAERAQLTQQIADPIRQWTDAAYLAGKFPREDYTDEAFPGWTTQAAALARRDRAVTTNAAVSQQVVRVIADRRTARLYVFAVGGRVGGATARLLLNMTAEKKSGERLRFAVAGNVYLTHKANHWRIFGYDLNRTVIR